MIARWLAIAWLVSFWVLIGGLITGQPAVRFLGLAGTLLFLAALFLWNWGTAPRPNPQVEGEDRLLIDVSGIDWSTFPDYRDQDRAA